MFGINNQFFFCKRTIQQSLMLENFEVIPYCQVLVNIISFFSKKNKIQK